MRHDARYTHLAETISSVMGRNAWKPGGVCRREVIDSLTNSHNAPAAHKAPLRPNMGTGLGDLDNAGSALKVNNVNKKTRVARI
jgi:hypothetical protein